MGCPSFYKVLAMPTGPPHWKYYSQLKSLCRAKIYRSFRSDPYHSCLEGGSTFIRVSDGDEASIPAIRRNFERCEYNPQYHCPGHFNLTIFDFQDSVWQDSVSIDGPPDRPPAYDQHPKQLQVLGADHPSTGTYDDSEGHSRSIILEEEDVKYDQMEFLRARQNSPLTSPSGSSHLDFSPTSSSSNRSRFHATPHPSRSSTTFIPGSLTKVQNDICKVVLDLLQEVVRQAHLPTSLDMLESCASTCHAHRIPFSALLQEASIAGHTPFYWVIVRWKGLRIGIGNRDHGGELLDHLIAFAAPLVPSTVADLRLGCLHLGPEAAGDRRSGNVANAVLQRLRRNPLVNAPSASDAILLEPVLESTSAQSWGAIGGVIKEGFGMFEDDVQVLELPGTLDRFVVQLQLKSFLRRMSITHSAVVEFIARGTLHHAFIVNFSDILPSIQRSVMDLAVLRCTS